MDHYIPLILNTATVKRQNQTNLATGSLLDNSSIERTKDLEAPADSQQTGLSAPKSAVHGDELSHDGGCLKEQPRAMAVIKGVLKQSTALLLLQDMHESYYCSFAYSHNNEKNDAGIGLFFSLK